MGLFDVRVFLTHCYVPSPVQMAENVVIEPIWGIGVLDTANLIDRYLREVLAQPPQPIGQKAAMSDRICDDGASAVVVYTKIGADSHLDAIRSTENSLHLYRDTLALRQMQRGYIAGFLSMRTDVSPVHLYSKVRHPYPILCKVQNLPFFETDSDIATRIVGKARRHPILQVYLSLYADSVSYSDTFISDISLETRLMKTWMLLEAMAAPEQGTKKTKVKALFKRFNTTTYPNYRGHQDLDLLDIAYKWRNVIVHAGGCSAATGEADTELCRIIQPESKQILDDLSQECRALLHAFAHSLS